MNRFVRILILAAALVCVLTSGKPAEQAFTVQGPQGNICALLHKPDGFRKGRSYPVVLIFHGFTGNKNEDMLIMLSEKLGQEGIASVRFDFNAHGESDGEFSGMTVANELQDAQAIYEYVKALPWSGEIAVAGHSQGGVIASLFSARNGADKVICEVLMAPAATIRDDVLVGKMLGSSFDPVNLPETVSVWGHTVGRAYLEFMQQTDVYAESGKFRGKACIIHGSLDTAVPPVAAFKYNEALPHPELHVLDGFTHGFGENHPYATGLAVDFLVRELK